MARGWDLVPVEPVEKWIREHGVGWRLVRVSGRTTKVDDAARLLGVDKSRIVKTLVVIACGEVYAVVVPGDRKLDMSRLASLVGCKPRLARPEEVAERTGYSVGGVPPVALPSHVKLIVDESLLRIDRAYGGGGEDGVLLEFSPKELVELVKPIVARVST